MTKRFFLKLRRRLYLSAKQKHRFSIERPQAKFLIPTPSPIHYTKNGKKMEMKQKNGKSFTKRVIFATLHLQTADGLCFSSEPMHSLNHFSLILKQKSEQKSQIFMPPKFKLYAQK
jgi:hypothetical protein